MLSRNRIIVFITLICLSFFIFFFSSILANFFTVESQVVAKSMEVKSEGPKKHGLKLTEVSIKEKNLYIQKEDNQPSVYFTFDDGPTEFTTEILNILASYQIKSTFFMLYGNILKYPNVVEIMKNEGHSLGCHGVTHRIDAFYKSATSPLEEMEACEKAIQSIIGENVPLIRVPFGSYPHLTIEQRQILNDHGYIMWDWNVDSIDWSLRSSEEVIEVVLNQIQALQKKMQTPVILFHDKKITAEALPTIIDRLLELGYSIKPIELTDEPLQFTAQ